MSGAGFTKLDVSGLSILWSLKWAGNHRSVRIEDVWMEEALAAINAPGGVGNMIPGIATKTRGFELLTFRKADAMLLMTSGSHSLATPESYGVVDLQRRLPEYLRDSK